VAHPEHAPVTGGVLLHASCVAFGERAVLILGPAGAGKSSLALQLMALGAMLVADDRTLVAADGARLVARAPTGLPALIEARGLGLLRAPLMAEAVLHLAVDLGATETARLPPRRLWQCCGIAIDCVHGPATAHFPAALRQYIMHGREA
jgi:HPr kinase/phosphorylase